jgi:1,2-diacylglycerol 3-alpha-glucosyltransferase
LHTKYEDYLHFIPGGERLPKSTVKYLIRAFLIGAQGLICPSMMTYETAARYQVKCPIRIIPTGIELNQFSDTNISTAEIQTLRAELGASENDTLLLSVSRLSQEKSIQNVIAAIAEIGDSEPVKLAIVGDGPYREELEKLVSELGISDRVRFTGMVPNATVQKYYRAADIFISASTSETQGLTFAEAIAVGTPVIAARNPYLSELVSEPALGELFDQTDDLAQIISRAIENRQPIPEKLLQRKRGEISSKTFAKKVEQFYREILAEHRRVRRTRWLQELSPRISRKYHVPKLAELTKSA